MTHKEFIVAIEEYYGEYPRETQKRMVYEFLQTYVEPDYLPTLYADTLKSFSSQYKAVPDIAVFNDLLPDKENLGYPLFDKTKYLNAPEDVADPKEASLIFKEFWSTIGKKGEVQL